MQALVRGGGVHVVRCAGLLGRVGMVARCNTQAAGRAGARYSDCFLPEWEGLVNDNDSCSMRLSVGLMLHVHDFALAYALSIAASDSGQWSHTCMEDIVTYGLGLVLRKILHLVQKWHSGEYLCV